MNCDAPTTRRRGGGQAPDGRRVRGTIHWVSAAHSLSAQVRIYDHLFIPRGDATLGDDAGGLVMNPSSMEVLAGCRVEPGLADASTRDRFQFERLGYFCLDSKDSSPDALVFNRAVSLRDTWAKIERAG